MVADHPPLARQPGALFTARDPHEAAMAKMPVPASGATRGLRCCRPLDRHCRSRHHALASAADGPLWHDPGFLLSRYFPPVCSSCRRRFPRPRRPYSLAGPTISCPVPGAGCSNGARAKKCSSRAHGSLGGIAEKPESPLRPAGVGSAGADDSHLRLGAAAFGSIP